MCSYRPKGKYVVIDPENPEAVGFCDKTGSPFLKKDLVKQMEWRGNSLQWTGALVGKPFVDKPNEQGRTPRLSEDPVPVKNPRPPQANFYTEPVSVKSEDERYRTLTQTYWNPKLT